MIDDENGCEGDETETSTIRILPPPEWIWYAFAVVGVQRHGLGFVHKVALPLFTSN